MAKEKKKWWVIWQNNRPTILFANLDTAVRATSVTGNCHSFPSFSQARRFAQGKLSALIKDLQLKKKILKKMLRSDYRKD